MKNEQECFYQIIDGILYDSDLFKIGFGEDKFIYGITTAVNREENKLSRMVKYDTLYKTLIDLDLKIKISFKKAIEYTYSKNVIENFSILEISSEEELLAYYYIENALFRTSSLWDILAQFYRLKYSLNIDVTKVYYKQIFNPNAEFSTSYKEKANTIFNYINEDDDTSSEGRWHGNHSFINNLRNKMTHRNSPNLSVISDFDVNFKHHPSLILKRTIEDYNIVSIFLREIIDEIIDIDKVE